MNFGFSPLAFLFVPSGSQHHVAVAIPFYDEAIAEVVHLIRQTPQRLPPTGATFSESRWADLSSAILFVTIGVFALHSTSILSGFSLNTGTLGDPRFVLLILEHWHKVISEERNLLQIPIFHPEENTLGRSETLLAFALAYSPLRLAGLEPYLAMQISVMIPTALGIAGLYSFCRSILGLSRFFSGCTALIGICSNAAAVHIFHLQLAANGLIPWILFFFFCGVRSQNQRIRFLYGLASGMTFALLAYTSVYIAWFFIFISLIAAATYIALLAIRQQTYKDKILGISTPMLGALATLPFYVPFYNIYAPVLRDEGGFSTIESINRLPHFFDFFYIERFNFIYNKVFTFYPTNPSGRIGLNELSMAFTPTLLLAMFLSVFFLIRYASKKYKTGEATSAILSAALSIPIIWLLLLKIGEFSLWPLLVSHIPGSQAIRAPFRINIVLAIPAAIAIGFIIDRRSRGSKWRPMGMAIMAFISVEQVGYAQFSFSREEESEHLETLVRDPAECSAFYAVDSELARYPELLTIGQVDAGLAAVSTGIPTYNGVTGRYPASWPNLHLVNPRYPVLMASWMIRMDPDNPAVCELDVGSARWTRIGNTHQAIQHLAPDYRVGEKIMFSEKESDRYVVTGLTGPGTWGRWTIAHDASLLLSPYNMTEGDLIMRLDSGAYLHPSKPQLSVDVYVNGTKLSQARFTDRSVSPYKPGTSGHEVNIPSELWKDKGYLYITFRILDPRSPKSVGRSNDTRLLGMAMRSIVFERAVSD